MATHDLTAAPKPMTSDHFERTIFRRAPKRFEIEFLPPSKTSTSYQHGMRITPIFRSDRSSASSSRGSESCIDRQYEIWRRWEDCLWLQDTLEVEYTRAAREKKMRLAQGKGVKMFNGMYKQDMASSWESLPPGPAPETVQLDVHKYLPYLTKKGTFFRPKPALVEKRQMELQTLIETLMGEGMPALIKEIRASRIVTDFFAFWRRDLEQEEKRAKKNPAYRSSITSSVFSVYFASSSPTSISPSSASTRTGTSPSRRSPSRRSDAMSDASSTLFSFRTRRSSTDTLEAPPSPVSQMPRARTDSSGSSSSEEVPSDSSYTANSSAPRIMAEERTVNFNHNPAQGASDYSPIEPIPEEQEIYLKAPVLDGHRPVQLRRRHRSTEDRKSNRNWSVYASPVANNFGDEPDSPCTRDDSTIGRNSWQSSSSAASADTYLEGLPFTLPQLSLEDRQSLASVSTWMTTDSANAVIPREPASPADSSFNQNRTSIPISLSDFEIVADSPDERFSTLDAFPRPLSYDPEMDTIPERPDTPKAHDSMIESVRSNNHSPRPTTARKDGRQLPPIITNRMGPQPSTDLEVFPTMPPSPTLSAYSSTYTISTISSDTSSTPTVSSASTITTLSTPATTPSTGLADSPSQQTQKDSKVGNISIKALHNGSIIMLRVQRDMSFSDVRQRLYNKFVGQEGVPLAQDFLVNYKPDGSSQDYPISSEDDWRDIAEVFDGGKLSLRIVNPS